MYYVLMDAIYNDHEGLLCRDGTNGFPRKVFTSKKKANIVARQKNISSFKESILNSDIKNFGSNLSDIISTKIFEDDLFFEEGIFMTIFGLGADDWWVSLKKLKYGDSLPLKIEPSPEQWEKLYDCFTVVFWEVVPVEKG
jgi:hypothetical protein